MNYNEARPIVGWDVQHASKHIKAYKEMASDEEREAEAQEWAEALIADVSQRMYSGRQFV